MTAHLAGGLLPGSHLPGIALGLVAGSGLLLVVLWLGARRPLPLILRVGPYIGIPGTAEASLRGRQPTRVRRRPSTAAAASRSEGTVLGVTTGLLVGVGLVAQGSSLIALALMAATGGVAGRWCASALARGRAQRRRRAIRAQLPMLADLLSLGVAAGLTPVSALESAAASLRGPIAVEVRATVADLHAGVSTEVALRGLAARVDLAEFDRFVEAILLAIAMGTPLAEVVRGQASDLRVEERRVLMEVAGRKDALMLVPIVFLVLPSVLVIALYPGLQSLRLVVP